MVLRSGNRFALVSHPTGSWLLYAEGRCFMLSPELGRRLERCSLSTWAPGVVDEFCSLLPAPCRGRGQSRTHQRGPRAIRPRVTLVSPELVGRLARLLSPLASVVGLTGLAVLGILGYWIGSGVEIGTGGFPDIESRSWLAVVFLIVMIALWHELGHATALSREGYPPGRIGAGLLFVIPVFFCDVTPVCALARSGRIRVDLAGVVFQLGAGGFCFWLGACMEATALRLAGLSALLAICWSLLPFMRADGYWLLCDLLGRDDLEKPVVGPSQTSAVNQPLRRHRLRNGVLLGYRLANVGFLISVCIVLPLRLAGQLPALGQWVANGLDIQAGYVEVINLLTTILFWALVSFLWWNAGRRILRLPGSVSTLLLIRNVFQAMQEPGVKVMNGDDKCPPESAEGTGEDGGFSVDPAEPVEMEIDGCLDLHMFAPREVKDLVPDYIEACLEAGIDEIRIVHGKGIGTLRTIVHGLLDKHPAVVSYGHRSDAGSWGATVVQLRLPVDPANESPPEEPG